MPSDRRQAQHNAGATSAQVLNKETYTRAELARPSDARYRVNPVIGMRAAQELTDWGALSVRLVEQGRSLSRGWVRVCGGLRSPPAIRL